MVDIALGLEDLVPTALYRGSVTENSETAFDALVWEDDRAKPTWTEVVAAAEAATAPTAEDVRAEAQRRMILLVGARHARHLEIKISNASREGIKLLRIGSGAWTQEQTVLAAYLESADAALDAIREKSNALEAMDPVPEDFVDERHWS